MLLAILYLVTFWLWLWLVFFGWGLLATKVLGCQRDDAESLLVTPWLGVAAVIALLTAWHFAAPINGWAFLAVSAIGILGVGALGRRQLGRLGAVCQAHRKQAVLGLLLVIWLANRSLNTQEFTDHGLYYLNAIRWNTDYSVVPGLGNLHHRLAFNNSNFLLHAMLEIGHWRGYSAHLVNGFFGVLALPIVIHGVWMLLHGQGRARQTGWFAIAIGMLLAQAVVDRNISSASSDVPAMLMVTIAAWRWLAMGLRATELQGNNFRWNLVVIAVLTAAAVTIKTTVIFFVVFAWLAGAVLLMGICRRRPEFTPWSMFPSVRAMLIGAAVLVVPWMARGYVLSGCPLFPSTLGRVSVDWAVSPEMAAELRETIYVWARTSHLDRDIGQQVGWTWVPTWLVQVILLRAPIEVVAPIVISLASVVWLAVAKRGSPPPADDHDVMAFAPILLATAYVLALGCWFLTAPSPRMGTFASWGLAATLLGMASQTLSASRHTACRPFVLFAIVSLLLLPTIHDAFLIETRYRFRPRMPEFGHHFYQYHPFILPTTNRGFPLPPRAELRTQTTRSGLEVYLSNDVFGRVWDSPLPASHYFDPNLALRRPGDMEAGFQLAPAAADVSAPREQLN